MHKAFVAAMRKTFAPAVMQSCILLHCSKYDIPHFCTPIYCLEYDVHQFFTLIFCLKYNVHQFYTENTIYLLTPPSCKTTPLTSVGLFSYQYRINICVCGERSSHTQKVFIPLLLIALLFWYLDRLKLSKMGDMSNWA